jgi:hypothetical protein
MGKLTSKGLGVRRGALDPCHGGGEVSIGRELKGAVALAEEGVRGEERARGRREATRGGRGSMRWSGGVPARRRQGAQHRRQRRQGRRGG